MASNSIPNFRLDSKSAGGMKRRRIEHVNYPEQNQITRSWRSMSEQRTYSSKLVEALRIVRVTSTLPEISSSVTQAVRETADRVLAVAAKGKTRWSRAILKNRIRIGIGIGLLRSNRKKEKVKSRRRRLPGGLHGRVRELGRLIPGCRKLPLPNLLEETTDYIAALEMQVRAMSAIADLLAGCATSPGREG